MSSTPSNSATTLSSQNFTLPAPAKLNLMLHIVGRRDDGYHLLQTLFQFLDIADQLHFASAEFGTIDLITDLAGVATEDNLIMKAARMLEPFCKEKWGADFPGVAITLEKNLPMGGGIGGGSSDCATTLLGLNHFWQLGLSIDQLAAMGLRLGADVPVFVRGFSAWAEGVGEQLTPIEPKEQVYIVLTPQCHISTQEIFSHPELTRDTKIMKIARVLDQGGHNDCEPIAKALYPEVAEALDWLSQYGKAQMTGTGACVFAGFDTVETASQFFSKKPIGWRGFITQGENISPLHIALTKLSTQQI